MQRNNVDGTFAKAVLMLQPMPIAADKNHTEQAWL